LTLHRKLGKSKFRQYTLEIQFSEMISVVDWDYTRTRPRYNIPHHQLHWYHHPLHFLRRLRCFDQIQHLHHSIMNPNDTTLSNFWLGHIPQLTAKSRFKKLDQFLSRFILEAW
jgi:hypothetical protein